MSFETAQGTGAVAEGAGSGRRRRDHTWGQRWVLTGCLTGLAVLGNWVPGLGPAGLGAWGGAALAQTPDAQEADEDLQRIAPEEVTQYAVAALALENARRELEATIGSNAMSGRTCGDVGQVDNLNPAIVTYCQNSKRIVEDTGLSADRFNFIYLRQRADTQLRLEILGSMAQACIDDNNLIAPNFCRDTIRTEMKKQCATQSTQINSPVCLRLRIEN
ncbi:MAG: DUF4168 domain-containing protein [Prochlorothrix sp.]